MRTVIVAAAAVLGLINIASANQPVHLHCAPKTTEIRVFLEPIREVRIHDEGFAAARRRSMIRIIARRTNAAAVVA